LGDGSREGHESKGIHDNLGLVRVKDEEPLDPCLAEGVQTGAEVKLNGSVDQGKDFAAKGGVHPDELGVHHLVLTDVGEPTLHCHMDGGLGPKENG
jgi:hypothetical protein